MLVRRQASARWWYFQNLFNFDISFNCVMRVRLDISFCYVAQFNVFLRIYEICKHSALFGQGSDCDGRHMTLVRHMVLYIYHYIPARITCSVSLVRNDGSSLLKRNHIGKISDHASPVPSPQI